MNVVIDIETNSLINPTQVWVIVCKDIDTGKYEIFRNVTTKQEEKERFLDYGSRVSCFIGHNCCEFDFPVLRKLCGLDVNGSSTKVVDTLIVGRLADFSRGDGHSIESYGLELGYPKIKFSAFSEYSLEMEAYCVRDVDICERVYRKYLPYITNRTNARAIQLEHQFQTDVVNVLHDNGFSFNTAKAEKLLAKVKGDLDALDQDIRREFPPRLRLVREINPRVTKHGTLHRSDFRWIKDGDLSPYSPGCPFCLCEWYDFNPSSHKQVVEVLHSAGWKPTDRTETHTAYLREKEKDPVKEEHFLKYGWKINENNLSTLPSRAPAPARTLAKRILLEARRRTLTEWLGLVDPDTNRIHGKFVGIGAWTHRMAHQKPNTANIPNEFREDGSIKLLGKELRSLWQAPKNRLLVGVDAEGIQLRIFAHYIDDKEFTESLINGRKSDRSDPHSLNQRIIGPICRTRQAAKRFIYALLLGAGIGKLAFILDTDEGGAKEALDRILERYQGFGYLKREVIPADAKRGYFIGLDGRRVLIPGDTLGERRHLCMSGYLQNGEAIIMKMATMHWIKQLEEDNSKLVNFVHDEWQTETPNNMEIALRVAGKQANSLRLVGEQLQLKCPLAGSYWNDDKKTETIGTNWSVTH